jgi:hypothetical protein
MALNLTDLRYDRPGVYWGCVAALVVAAALGSFLVLPANEFFRALGITEAQDRAHALKNAGYWYSRSLIHASSKDLAFQVRYGNVVHFDGEAVITSIPEGERFEEVALHFADVVVKSPRLADQAVREARFKNARFEIYDQDKSVVWIDGKPLNITLIEIGAADPDPTPPTNIVDLAFASYYWAKLKGD